MDSAPIAYTLHNHIVGDGDASDADMGTASDDADMGTASDDACMGTASTGADMGAPATGTASTDLDGMMDTLGDESSDDARTQCTIFRRHHRLEFTVIS